MDKELKAKWIAALRSGEYKQATKLLHDVENGGYCCLGVLCEVVKPPEWDGRTVSAMSVKGMTCFEGILGLELAVRLGVDTHTSTLMHMNDGTSIYAKDPKTFAQIADYIEENL